MRRKERPGKNACARATPSRHAIGSPRSSALLASIAITMAVSGCRTLDVARDPEREAPAQFDRAWIPTADAVPSPNPPAPSPPEPLQGDAELGPDALVAIALRNNPATRGAYEEARAAAARLGVSEAAYLPRVDLESTAGWSQRYVQSRDGKEIIRGSSLDPGIALTLVLLDFGRRAAARDSALQQLFAANFSFNRTLQEVVFESLEATFRFDASRARVEATRAALDAARLVERAVAARLDSGLATKPDFLLARQETLRAQYALADAEGRTQDARATLATSLGLVPSAPLRVRSLAQLPLPPALSESVDAVVDRALAQRPDLAAKLAELRQRDAEVRRARAEFLPTVSLAARSGGFVTAYRAGPPMNAFNDAEPEYAVGLVLEWPLFEGFARVNTLRAAQSARDASAEKLEAAQLAALREVWKSYTDVETASSKFEFAGALVAAAQESFDANLESYRNGLATAIDLIVAERELANARFTEIDSRADVLVSSAALAYAAGEGP